MRWHAGPFREILQTSNARMIRSLTRSVGEAHLVRSFDVANFDPRETTKDYASTRRAFRASLARAPIAWAIGLPSVWAPVRRRRPAAPQRARSKDGNSA